MVRVAALYVAVTPSALGTYVGEAPCVGVEAGVGEEGGGAGAASASATLIRPNDCPATGSVVPRIWLAASLLVRPLAMSKAARPATSPAAADVPLMVPYVPPTWTV